MLAVSYCLLIENGARLPSVFLVHDEHLLIRSLPAHRTSGSFPACESFESQAFVRNFGSNAARIQSQIQAKGSIAWNLLCKFEVYQKVTTVNADFIFIGIHADG